MARIPFHPSIPDLYEQLRIRAGSSREAELQDLLGQAQAIARPQAMFRIAFIEGIRDDQVILDGVVFTSRVLRINLIKTEIHLL